MGEGGIVKQGQITTWIIKEIGAVAEHEGRGSAVLEASVGYDLRRAAFNDSLRSSCRSSRE